MVLTRVRKKMKNQKKNNRKNRTVKKKPIKILKKLTGLVQFYNSETKKTKPKKNQVKSEKTDPNRKNQAKPIWTGFVLKNQTKLVSLNRYRFSFFLNQFNYIFNKNQTKQKK